MRSELPGPLTPGPGLSKARTVTGMVGVQFAILVIVLVFQALAPFSYLSLLLMSRILKVRTVTGMVGIQVTIVYLSASLKTYWSRNSTPANHRRQHPTGPKGRRGKQKKMRSPCCDRLTTCKPNPQEGEFHIPASQNESHSARMHGCNFTGWLSVVNFGAG